MGKHALLQPLVTGIRGSWRNGYRASAALAVALLFAPSAGAEGLEPTLLTYRAPVGCPEVAEFQQSVQRRSGRVRFVNEGSHARALSIELSKQRNATIGELRLIERDRSVRQRRVRFSSCAEAVEGLALITVVSLDPQALLEAPPPEAVAEEQKPLPPPTPPSPKPTPRTPAALPAPRTERPAHAPAIELALGAELVAGVRQAPRIALGGALFVDLASSSGTLLAPLLRLEVAHTERRSIPTGDARASFALTQATLTVCPFELRQGPIAARPCAFTSAGVLRASGSDAAGQHGQSRPSWAWGGSVLAFARVTQTLELQADFNVGSPLIRDRFEARPGWTWRTPALYVSSGIGVRLLFR